MVSTQDGGEYQAQNLLHNEHGLACTLLEPHLEKGRILKLS